MKFLWQYLAIGIAGAAGAIARAGIGQVFQVFFTGVRFPVATMFINVGGSLFLGWFYTLAAEPFRFPM